MLLMLVASFSLPPLAEADSKEEEDLTKSEQLKTRFAHPLRLRLVWYDNYQLLPGSVESMFQEVNRIFAEMGVDVHWEMGREADKAENSVDDPLKSLVILIPSTSSSWGLKKDVMGLATHREGMKGSVYIFHPQIVRTLEFDDTESPYALKYLARAIGRVVVHETVHVLAPHYPHTETGLMERHLSRRFLMQPAVHMDAVSARVVRAEIQALGNQILLAWDHFGAEFDVIGAKAALRPPVVKDRPR
jgi:hypothetical protein